LLLQSLVLQHRRPRQTRPRAARGAGHAGPRLGRPRRRRKGGGRFGLPRARRQ
jgi:hypothetical protein